MRLRFLSIIPLLLTGCGVKEYHYYNVYHQWNSTTKKHLVRAENKEYKLNVDDVHYVFVKQYPCADTCDRLAYNEFYVKGSSYRLIVYTLDK